MSVRSKLLFCYTLAVVIALTTSVVALLFVHPMLVVGPLSVMLGYVFLTAYLGFPKRSIPRDRIPENRNENKSTRPT